MSTKNKMLDILSAVDERTVKEDLIKELSDPLFQIGFKSTVINLVKKMVNMGYLEEEHKDLVVTPKGKEFLEKTPFDDTNA